MRKSNAFSMEYKNIEWMGVRVDETNKFTIKYTLQDVFILLLSMQSYLHNIKFLFTV